jgi:hypothetical protein
MRAQSGPPHRLALAAAPRFGRLALLVLGQNRPLIPPPFLVAPWTWID